MADNQQDKCWVGFDLGGTKMLASVFDDEYKQLGSKRRRTKGHEGQKAGLERIRGTLDKALEEAEVEVGQIAGIGIGCPGPLDLEAGIIREAPNLAWYDVPITPYLQDIYKCPVVLVNDVDAGVYGEYVQGAARGADCALGIFPGTGIGGGCVFQGEMIKGRTASCMEIGHMQVLPDGPLCGCGQKGCLEAVASRLAISAAAAAAAYRGQAPYLRKTAGTDLSDIRSSVIAESIAAGDEAVAKIVQAAAESIGSAIASLVNLLLPDTVVLGGGLVEAMPELFVKPAAARARRQVLPTYAKAFRIVPAQLGDNAAVIGAAAWARHQIAADLGNKSAE